MPSLSCVLYDRRGLLPLSLLGRAAAAEEEEKEEEEEEKVSHAYVIGSFSQGQDFGAPRSLSQRALPDIPLKILFFSNLAVERVQHEVGEQVRGCGLGRGGGRAEEVAEAQRGGRRGRRDGGVKGSVERGSSSSGILP